MVPEVVQFETEKLELESILGSGIFQRAPIQAQLLSYICARYFANTAGEMKEYTIAVEALGRPAHFDHRKDSIVRVEFHQLRKRLREYYAGEGADHAVKIEIPAGQYVPRFVFQHAPETETALTVAEPLPAAIPIASPPSFIRRRGATIAIAAGVLVLIAAGLLFARSRRVSFARNGSAAAVPRVPAMPPSPDIRIMAGVEDGTYVDSFGHLWQSDRYFNGGWAAHSADHPILGTHDAVLYQNRREGPASYDIPLKPGVYELRLHFAETVYGEGNLAGGGETSRLFNIRINNREVRHEFDVIANAGPSAATVLVFRDISPAADGKLHLALGVSVAQPFLNGIEITPGIPGRMRPILLVARDHAYTDRDGRYWLPDRYARGGQLVFRTTALTGTPMPSLYAGERFGNFTYAIPVAPGRYRLTLHFAERWFGPGKPAAGGEGSRVFDVLCNGVALVKALDIYKAAGGPDKALTLSFDNLEPTAQGSLNIAFQPRVNYASVDALEVVDEADVEGQ